MPSTRAALRRPGVLIPILHKEGCFRLAFGIVPPYAPAGLVQPRRSWFRRCIGGYYTGEFSEPSIVPGHVADKFKFQESGLYQDDNPGTARSFFTPEKYNLYKMRGIYSVCSTLPQ